MQYEQIVTDVVDGVLTITLNRPDRLNAWTATMGEELIAAFDEADAGGFVASDALEAVGEEHVGNRHLKNAETGEEDPLHAAGILCATQGERCEGQRGYQVV